MTLAPVLGVDTDEDTSDFEQPPTVFARRKVPSIQASCRVIETLLIFSASHFSQGSASSATNRSSTQSTLAPLISVNTMKQVAILAVTHHMYTLCNALCYSWLAVQIVLLSDS